MSAHPHPTSEESGSIWKILNVIIAIVVGGFTLFWAITFLIGAKAETSGWNKVEAVTETAPAAEAAAPAATETPAAAPAATPGTAPAPAAPATAEATAPALTPAPEAAQIALKVDVANPLAYDIKEFSVKSGQAVKLTFNNVHPAVPQPHNVVIGVSGSKDKLLALAMQMATSPDGMAKGYIPESPDILFHTKLLQPGQSETIEFTAPAAGDYPYMCTFPGHGIIMNGIMRVE
ncbi:azurin [Prosthecobacter fusiformis]|uniref:Azurin n=1 Tax=Prosthecobacter fusiformis TaxID=48464 RepID=A0A4R7SR50_9BACT|nr:plastocyanin/azurin family copper-binding protein [Prosthecobacter fusiformis]TDU81099.1 azurin [Prosthecobacter fusiformis]